MPSSTYYAVLLGLVLGVGCASTPTMENVVGTYEGAKGKETFRIVLLNKDQMKAYENGKKIDLPFKWRITDGEVVISTRLFSPEFEAAMFLLVERGGNLTLVAEGINGVRKDLSKEEYVTFNRID